MGDGATIGGWILAAAVVTVLAGGASAAGGSGTGSSGGRGSSAGTTTSATRTTATTSKATTARATTGKGTTGNGTTRPAAPCTRVSTISSADGTRYHRVPVSSDGSYLCGLEPGDRGRPVTILQQALALCSDRAVTVDASYNAETRAAVTRDQRRQLGATPDGVYGPSTAKGLRWPWFDRSTDAFTGHCALAGERSG